MDSRKLAKLLLLTVHVAQKNQDGLQTCGK